MLILHEISYGGGAVAGGGGPGNPGGGGAARQMLVFSAGGSVYVNVSPDADKSYIVAPGVYMNEDN